MQTSNKLREAMKRLDELLYIGPDGEVHGALGKASEIERIVKDALAAPPRNCDKVKTSWDVLKEWHEGLDTANDIVRMLGWLLAPATEKEGEEK